MRRIVLLALCLTLSLTGLALAKGGKVYKGTDNQGGSVTITAKKHKVTTFSDFTRVCGSLHNFMKSGPLKIGPKGHFSGAGTAGTKISGKRSGKMITGSIVLKNPHCSGTVTYTATTK